MGPDIGSSWSRTRDTRALTGEEKMQGKMPRTEARVMQPQARSFKDRQPPPGAGKRQERSLLGVSEGARPC